MPNWIEIAIAVAIVVALIVLTISSLIAAARRSRAETNAEKPLWFTTRTGQILLASAFVVAGALISVLLHPWTWQ